LNGMLEGEALRAGLDMPAQLCALGIVPEMPADGRIGNMRLVLAQGSKVVRPRSGRTAESHSLALQGAFA
jgi:hypothetical protein